MHAYIYPRFFHHGSYICLVDKLVNVRLNYLVEVFVNSKPRVILYFGIN